MSSGRILVVGAGVAGAAAARALAGLGHDVTLVERRSDEERTADSGLGLNLPGNAVRALRQLGAAGRVEASGVPVLRREYRNARGRLLFDVDEEAFWSGVAPSFCVRRGVLVDALLAGVDVRRGQVSGVHRRDSGALVSFAEGLEEEYDLVIGADGIGSTVRPAVSPATPVHSAMTASSWRFVIPDPGVGCWTAWTGDGVTFLMIPVAKGEVYAYAASNGGGAVGTDRRWLETAFAAFASPVTDAVAATRHAAHPPYHSRVQEIRSASWHDGRVLVLGDAAHAMGPVWAQGAALAVEDALVLARLLSDGGDWTSAVARWEQIRRPRVEAVMAATDRMSRLARLPDWLLNLAGPRLGPRGYQHTYTPLREDPVAERLFQSRENGG